MCFSLPSVQCATWNIKRGLFKRENELKDMLSKENIDIMFVTESDTNALVNEEDFVLNGYKTIFHLRENQNEKIRLIGLVKMSLWPKIIIRHDLMSTGFHSIWLEIADPTFKIKATLISGFYRVWTHNLENSEASQLKRWKIFTSQINSAAKNDANIFVKSVPLKKTLSKI